MAHLVSQSRTRRTARHISSDCRTVKPLRFLKSKRILPIGGGGRRWADVCAGCAGGCSTYPAGLDLLRTLATPSQPRRLLELLFYVSYIPRQGIWLMPGLAHNTQVGWFID